MLGGFLSSPVFFCSLDVLAARLLLVLPLQFLHSFRGLKYLPPSSSVKMAPHTTEQVPSLNLPYHLLDTAEFIKEGDVINVSALQEVYDLPYLIRK